MWQYHIDKLLFYLTCVQINTCVQMNKHPILIPSKMIQFLQHYTIWYTLFEIFVVLPSKERHINTTTTR